MRTFGEIQERPGSFEWSIPDFFSLSEILICSPEFECGGATLSLGMVSISPEYIFLTLEIRRAFSYSEDVHYFTYFITAGCTQVDITTVVKQGELLYGILIERSQLLEAKDQLVPNGVLTVLCAHSFNQSIEKGVQLMNEERSIEKCTTGKETSKKEEEEFDGKDVFRIPRGVDKTIHDLKSLLLNERDCDITLKVQDREFRAHKLILGARSPVFYSMFHHDTLEKSSGVVDISDCNPDSFKDFLVYMYSGRVEKLDSSNALSLYSVADKYNVDDLKKDCLELMEKELSVDTFGDVIALAVLHSESALIESATAFFTKNVKKIIVTVKWQSFLNQNPTAANELHIKALDVLIPE